MRWTWVSTQMLSGRRCATMRTRFAVLRPTPGSVSSSAIVAGTTPQKSASSFAHVAFTCTALLR